MPHRTLLLAAVLAGVLSGPFGALAIEASKGSAQGIEELVAGARELLPIIRGQIRDVDVAIQRAMSQTGDTTRMLSMGPEYRELKRSATDLTDISNKVFSLASRCGADAKKIGQDFRSSVRRLTSDVNRIGSSSSTAFARMVIEDLDRDLERVAAELQVVAAVPECSPDLDDEPANEASQSGS